MADEPFTPQQVKKLIRQIIKSGTVSFSDHALKEAKKDGLSTVDCEKVLQGGIVEPPELQNGSWRYRVRTALMYVVVAFRSESHLVVVTTWRIKK